MKRSLAYLDRKAPIVRVQDFNGKPSFLGAGASDVEVIFFWATWCSRSASQIEDLNEIAQSYRSNRRVSFNAISVDKFSDFEKLRERVEEEKLYSVRHFFSGNGANDEAYVRFRGEIVPMVIVVSPSRKVVLVDDSLSDLRKTIQRYL